MTEMDTVVIVAVATPTGRSSLQFNLNLANKMLKVDPNVSISFHADFLSSTQSTWRRQWGGRLQSCDPQTDAFFFWTRVFLRLEIQACKMMRGGGVTVARVATSTDPPPIHVKSI